MSQTRCWATAAAAVVSIGWVGVSTAATLNVPGDFATIQACIDAAVSGVDECVVLADPPPPRPVGRPVVALLGVNLHRRRILPAVGAGVPRNRRTRE